MRSIFLLAILYLLKESLSLKCYICSNSYPNTVIYQHDDCETPNATDSQLIPIECNSFQDTCETQRVTKNGILRSIARFCTTSDSCATDNGCLLQGYGITTATCSSCCTEDGCNTDNTSTIIKNNSVILILIIIMSLY